jgi:hypothetical protein
VPLVGRDGRRLGHVQHVEQVVGDAAAFRFGGLGGADVHAPVELHRVGVDDLAAERAGQVHGQRGLAGGRRPDHRDRDGGAVHGG